MRFHPGVERGVSSIFVLLALGVGWAYWRRLPDQVPVHWSAQGTPDGWLPRPAAVLVVPLIMLAMFVLLPLLERISPRGFGDPSLARTAHAVRAVLLAGCAGVQFAMLRSAVTGRAEPTVPYLALAALLIVVGISLARLGRNFFIGVRTPWTLAHPDIWGKTNRVASWTVTAAGVGLAAVGLSGREWTILLPTVLVLAGVLVPALFSFLLWWREHGGEEARGEGK